MFSRFTDFTYLLPDKLRPLAIHPTPRRGHPRQRRKGPPTTVDCLFLQHESRLCRRSQGSTSHKHRYRQWQCQQPGTTALSTHHRQGASDAQTSGEHGTGREVKKKKGKDLTRGPPTHQQTFEEHVHAYTQGFQGNSTPSVTSYLRGTFYVCNSMNKIYNAFHYQSYGNYFFGASDSWGMSMLLFRQSTFLCFYAMNVSFVTGFGQHRFHD